MAALVMPSLYLISRTPWYPAIRVGGALFGFVAALAWMLERLGASSNPLDETTARLGENGLVLSALLAIVAVAAWLSTRTMVSHEEH